MQPALAAMLAKVKKIAKSGEKSDFFRGSFSLVENLRTAVILSIFAQPNGQFRGP